MRSVLAMRFQGLLWAQMSSSFSGSFLKQSVLLMVLFQGGFGTELQGESWAKLAFVSFLSGFALASTVAGQFSDRFDRAHLLQRLKLFEVVVSFVATAGLLLESAPILLLTFSLFGVQTAFLNPLKYSSLPQLLGQDRLIEGNAAMETGFQLAALLGIIGASTLVESDKAAYLCSWGLFLASLLGFFAARQIPTLPPAAPELSIDWNPVRSTLQAFHAARESRSVYLSALGVSWFWLMGWLLLTLLPTYAQSILNASSRVGAALGVLFCLGVALGSLICSKLSSQRLELGIVPFGSLGLSIFLADLAYCGTAVGNQPSKLLSLTKLLSEPSGWRPIFDVLALSVGAGLFVIPLYTLILERSRATARGQVFAATNMMGAVIVSLGVTLFLVLDRFGWSVNGKFLFLAALNIAVCFYIYSLIPEFFLRFSAYILNRVVYRLKVSGKTSVPREGPALLVGNHVSYIDWMIVLGGVDRPVRFVMWHTYYNLPLVRYLFRDAGAIPIGSGKTHPELLARAFDEIDKCLASGGLVCLFPEGQLTSNGEVGEFRNGVERILERRSVPVIPFALQGLWDSLFSRQPHRSTLSRLKRLLRPHVNLIIGSRISPPPPNSLHGLARELRHTVLELRQDER